MIGIRSNHALFFLWGILFPLSVAAKPNPTDPIPVFKTDRSYERWHDLVGRLLERGPTREEIKAAGKNREVIRSLSLTGNLVGYAVPPSKKNQKSEVGPKRPYEGLEIKLEVQGLIEKDAISKKRVIQPNQAILSLFLFFAPKKGSGSGYVREERIFLEPIHGRVFLFHQMIKDGAKMVTDCVSYPPDIRKSKALLRFLGQRANSLVAELANLRPKM